MKIYIEKSENSNQIKTGIMIGLVSSMINLCEVCCSKAVKTARALNCHL